MSGAKRVIAQQMAGQEPPQTLFGLASSIPQAYLQRTNDAWNSGIDMANAGAEQLQQGDPMGAFGMIAGPAAAISAPVSAMFPSNDAWRYVGEHGADAIGADPRLGAAIAGAGGTMVSMMAPTPGGKFPKGTSAFESEAMGAPKRLLDRNVSTGERVSVEAPAIPVPVVKTTPEELARIALSGDATKPQAMALIKYAAAKHDPETVAKAIEIVQASSAKARQPRAVITEAVRLLDRNKSTERPSAFNSKAFAKRDE